MLKVWICKANGEEKPCTEVVTVFCAGPAIRSAAAAFLLIYPDVGR